MLNRHIRTASLALLASLSLLSFSSAHADQDRDHGHSHHNGRIENVQVGVRPYYLIDGMDDSPLKTKLEQCKNGPFYTSKFSISHRGAPLEFPEHSKESYTAAARMGAGIMECDVSFTKDGELVCRHSECDLHTTTDIVNTELNASCSVPWTAGGSPTCCTSDITLAEYKTLRAKMDARNPAATTAAGYLGGTANWRTDVYTGRPAGNVVTLKEHIELVKKWGISQTPELKAGNAERIASIFGSQEKYAQKMIDTYKEAGVDPHKVFAQSFQEADVLYWIKHEPEFGKRALLLDNATPRMTNAKLAELKAAGVTTIAPTMAALLSVNAAGQIVPSQYALDIKAAGLKIVAWSFERENLTKGAAGNTGYYVFDNAGAAIKKDSDMYKALDVLARKVGVEGVFSDWPGTVTYYANCMGL
jgi:glycerophosphoryl diester phosphodiesterase